MWVPSRAFLSALVGGIGDDTLTSNRLPYNGWLGLFRSAYAPTIDTVLSELTEADFDGYARHHLTAFLGPYIGENGSSLIQAPSVLWAPSGHDTVNTIYGHFIVGSDSVTLLMTEVFDAPIPLPNETYAFTDVVVIGLLPNTPFGLSIVAN